jgi:hypothetical protein
MATAISVNAMPATTPCAAAAHSRGATFSGSGASTAAGGE